LNIGNLWEPSINQHVVGSLATPLRFRTSPRASKLLLMFCAWHGNWDVHGIPPTTLRGTLRRYYSFAPQPIRIRDSVLSCWNHAIPTSDSLMFYPNDFLSILAYPAYIVGYPSVNLHRAGGSSWTLKAALQSLGFASANRWSRCDPTGRSHVSTATAGCRRRERYVLRSSSNRRGVNMGKNGIIMG